MRKIGLVAFTATTCVLVPAALHGLVAGEEQIAKLSKPDADTFALGTATIGVALDRYILDPGGTLNIHIAATDAPAGPLALGVLVLGSSGSEGDRVPSPPVGVAHKTLVLDVENGLAKGSLSLPLEGASGSPYDAFANYTILVGPRDTIAKLERLRKGTRLVQPKGDMPYLNKTGEAFMTAYWQSGASEPAEDAPTPYSGDAIARVEAHVRPKSDAIAISFPERTTAGEAFTATVTIKNPSRRAMEGLEVSIQEHLGFGPGAYDNATHLSIVPEIASIDVAAGQSAQVTFQVTSDAKGVFGLLAQANCSYTDDETVCRDVQALQLGAFDATETFAPGERPITVVSR